MLGSAPSVRLAVDSGVDVELRDMVTEIDGVSERGAERDLDCVRVVVLVSVAVCDALPVADLEREGVAGTLPVLLGELVIDGVTEEVAVSEGVSVIVAVEDGEDDAVVLAVSLEEPEPELEPVIDSVAVDVEAAV